MREEENCLIHWCCIVPTAESDDTTPTLTTLTTLRRTFGFLILQLAWNLFFCFDRKKCFEFVLILFLFDFFFPFRCCLIFFRSYQRQIWETIQLITSAFEGLRCCWRLKKPHFERCDQLFGRNSNAIETRSIYFKQALKIRKWPLQLNIAKLKLESLERC